MAKFLFNPLGLVVAAFGIAILLLGAFGVNFVGVHAQSSISYGSLSVSPSSVSLGGTITLTGSGFTPNGYATLTFTRVNDGQPWAPDSSPARETLNSVGGFGPTLLQAGGDPNCPSQCAVLISVTDNAGVTAQNTIFITQSSITTTTTSSATSAYGSYILQLAFADCSGNYVSSGIVSVTGTQITGAQFSRTSNIDPSISRVIFSSVPAGSYLIWFNGAQVGNVVVTTDSTHQFSVCNAQTVTTANSQSSTSAQTQISTQTSTSTGQTTITSQSTTATVPVTSTITSQSAITTTNSVGYTTSYSTNVATVYSSQYNPTIAVSPSQLTAKPGTLQTFTVIGSGFPDSGQVTVFFIGPTSFSFIAQISGGSFNINGQGVVLSGSYSVYAVLNANMQTSYTQAQTYITTSNGIVQNVVSQTVVVVSGYSNVQSNTVLVSVNTNAAGLPSAHISITPSDVISQSGQLAVTGYGFSPSNTITLYFENPYYQTSRQYLTDANGGFTDSVPMSGLGAGTYNVYVVDSQTGFQEGPYQIIVTSGNGAPTFTVNLPDPVGGQYVTQTAVTTTTYPNGQVITQTVTSASLSTSSSGITLPSLSGTTVEEIVGGGIGLLGAAFSFIPKKP